MNPLPVFPAAAASGRLAAALDGIRMRGGMDIAFFAEARSADAVQVTAIRGGLTGTLDELVIERGAGLGGKALALMRPAAVSSYRHAAGITHAYDAQVLGEGIETLTAFPVVDGDVPRFVVYLGLRSRARVGDRWFDSVLPLVRELGAQLAAEGADGVAGVPSPESSRALSRAELRAALHELSQLAELAGSPLVRQRLDRLRTRLALASAEETPEPVAGLTRREIEVLGEISRGLTNRMAGANLGLVENTVKSYLKSAMRKLNAGNRVQAITAAKRLGVID